MTAWKSHGRGTPILRMYFRGIGRIERAIGFTDPTMLPRLKEMLRVLYESGKADELLRSVRATRLSLRQVWAVYRAGTWDRLPTPEHALPFGETFEAWRQQKPSAAYRRFAGWARAALERARRPATLADLRAACLLYRAACDTARQGAMFNRVVATLRAFLRDTITTEHAVALELAMLEALPEVVKRAKNPQRPDEAFTIREALAVDRPDAAAAWWTLCCTGMLPDELCRDKWAIEDGRVRIRGTKRDARDRVVPLLDPAIGPTNLTTQQLQRALRAAGLGIRPKDGRDSFALWCDLAGIPEGWKAALLGHAAGTVTRAYGWQETERIFGEVEEKLRALLATRLGGGTTRGTVGRESRDEADAPRRTRTPSLLIRSQADPRTTRTAKADEPEGTPANPDEDPPKPAGYLGGQPA